MRIPVIAGNWKMNKNIVEAVSLVKELKDFVRGIKGVDIVVCPPFTSLWVVKEIINGTNILLGAQNMYWETKGAFTGETSPPMLKDVGCEYIILGHSERRQYFKETSEEVAKKTEAALSVNLIPIVCVGENLKERESGETKALIEQEIKALFSKIDSTLAGRIIVAYEPIWAIGTGRSSSSQDANIIIKFIRELFSSEYGSKIAEGIRILYGGSVDPKNISEFMNESDIDGALVGGASLYALSFSQIVKAAEIL
ncbi:triose-phosphate isomerase [Candidatus Atribacteria bacterium RBG_19FT_COMBO_35_14]|uniref:Triosephosphate isomerase n=1 Tax=Candidatus Sediminicultor quintus TaxID=1797291 RepID=A0A1F5A6Y5_9BACT|nr:MAG: triose-phosphate isomerase [Candidatus Atribacteria bacterium RBG_19FT_COMBO_35_14]OGD33766.1 MAG: triose-phosphate isomerase [Candidatus Atribacteria bacterium RBG_16_35_8]